MGERETYTAEEVRERLRQACHEAGSARRWAAANGVSESHVSRFLAGQYRPGLRIERALKLFPMWGLTKHQ